MCHLILRKKSQFHFPSCSQEKEEPANGRSRRQAINVTDINLSGVQGNNTQNPRRPVENDPVGTLEAPINIQHVASDINPAITF